MSKNVKKATQKCLILWNLFGSSYKKMLIKNPKYVIHSLYVLETHYKYDFKMEIRPVAVNLIG